MPAPLLRVIVAPVPVGLAIFGLQLADILAHPIKRDALAKKGLVPDKADNFSKELCKVINGKFRCHPGTGRVEGYGIKWL